MESYIYSNAQKITLNAVICQDADTPHATSSVRSLLDEIFPSLGMEDIVQKFDQQEHST